MNKLSLGHLSAEDVGEGQANMPKAVAGAFAGAILLGIVYGVVGKFIGEFSYAAFLIGGATGLGAMVLGGGRGMVVGLMASAVTLVGVLVGKLICGAPEGVSWVAYHTTMFDILFCYLAPPVVAFFASGTDAARDFIRKYIPV